MTNSDSAATAAAAEFGAADLLREAAGRAERYLAGLEARAVFPTAAALAGLSAFDEPLPATPQDARATLALLDEAGSPATVASAGQRYFGFVTGGSLPVTVAANWLATAWDQNGGPALGSPVAAKLEQVALGWLVQALGLPAEAGGGFVTGATMANFAGLAAARHALLRRKGWDVEAQGLFGAPPLTVVVGEEVHVSLLKALGLLGLGRERVVRAPVDGEGRMRAEALPALTDTTVVCIQAGNVNNGAFDPAEAIIARARAAGAWVHVDGAFGLWAAAAPGRAHLMAGYAEADSWATDAHKWLNVPYDSGLAFTRRAADLRGAMSHNQAAYLLAGDERVPMEYTPEMSRRARGIEVWAALRTLGRDGLAEMIERCCQLAARLAEGLRAAGFEVLNEVALNQVLVSFGEAEDTRRVMRELQMEGTGWAGTTVWHGRTAMRISVSSWATTEADAEQLVKTLTRLARG
ncbi:MAG: aspartate aminotransferase family protein [Anaerolineales bacterium]|nr:aspartate aminotransferase family protein [Anaerolineales bacterium]